MCMCAYMYFGMLLWRRCCSSFCVWVLFLYFHVHRGVVELAVMKCSMGANMCHWFFFVFTFFFNCFCLILFDNYSLTAECCCFLGANVSFMRWFYDAANEVDNSLIFSFALALFSFLHFAYFCFYLTISIRENKFTAAASKSH